MWQIFIMYFLFGTIFSIGKIGLLASPPFFLTAIRMFLAGLILCFYLLYKSPQVFRFSKETWKLLLLVAFFNVFITNAFEFWGLQYMSAGKTCLIYSLSPFAAALIGYFSGSESITWKKFVGLFIGFGAFLPMMLEPWLNETTVHPMEFWGELALVVSAVTAVVGWTYVRQLTVTKDLSYTFVNGVSFLLAGGMSLATSYVFENWSNGLIADDFEFVYAVLYITLVHNIICYSIYASSLKKFSVTFMAFAGLSNPLFAAVVGYLYLDEPIHLTFWIAMVGVVIGLYFYYSEEKDVSSQLSY